jgi:hypothetical protein
VSLSVGDKAVEVPGLRTRSFLDVTDPLRPPRTPKRYRPKGSARPPSGVIWHSVHGTADGTVVDDPAVCANESEAMAYARAFARHNGRQASSHLIVADSGVVLCVADLLLEHTWHAGRFNPHTVGIELDQEGPRGVCAPLLAAAVDLAWWLSRTLGIQPMIPARRIRGVLEPDLRDFPRILVPGGERSFRGHFFHANCPERGEGDPGPALGRALLASGFEGFDVRALEDRDVWRKRQKALGFSDRDADGDPGPMTREALRAAGHPDGIFARRTA